MESPTLPAALRQRLGAEASAGLVEFVQVAGEEWKDDVIERAVDRFERRLAEEVGALRVDMVNGFASLRLEMTEDRAAIRREIAAGDAALRKEMTEGQAGLRQEMATGRVELLKWAFLFWIGQVAAITAIMSALLR